MTMPWDTKQLSPFRYIIWLLSVNCFSYRAGSKGTYSSGIVVEDRGKLCFFPFNSSWPIYSMVNTKARLGFLR